MKHWRNRPAEDSQRLQHIAYVRRSNALSGTPYAWAIDQPHKAAFLDPEPDTIERTLRFLFTFDDGVLARDYTSAWSPLPPTRDHVEELQAIVKAYLRLRRKAGGWKPGKDGANNHAKVVKGDLDALLTQARQADQGERPKPGKYRAICESCSSVFYASRKSARFCSEACKKRAKRDRARKAA